MTAAESSAAEAAVLKRSLLDMMVGQGVDWSLIGGRILPVVVDTNVLLNDLMQTVKRGHPTALVEAARLGSIRLFAAEHVADEMAERLPTYATRRNRGDLLEELQATWDAAYWPLVHLVAVPHDLQNDLVARVRSRDADDAPTAALACLLAPCLVFTDDDDLAAHGLIPNPDGVNWLARALAVRDEAHAEILVAGGVRLTAQVAAAVWDGLTELPAAWRPAALAIVAGGLVLLWQRGALSPVARARAMEQLRPL